MPTPITLLAALHAFQQQAETICASAAWPGLLPNCCFDTDRAATTLSIEVRDAAGQLVLTALTEDPLADLARQLGVTYPVQYAIASQKETLKRLLDAAGASAAERTTHLLAINSYTYAKLEAINADLNRRAGIAAAADAQHEVLSYLQRQAA